MNVIQSGGGGTIVEEAMPATPPGSMVLLFQLSRVLYRRATEAVLGMSLKEYLALSTLREQPYVTQQALGEVLHLDPNNCVLLLNVLESSRLAERRRDPDDRRRHIVELTAEGREALARADRGMESVEDEVLGPLDAADRRVLRDLLARAMEAHQPAQQRAPATAD
jgi:MarR family transcriptional regulator, temperature-dependent positive regulator of motility